MSYQKADSYKLSLPIGTDVVLKVIPNWLRKRVEHGYCLARPGMKGKIIGYTAYSSYGQMKIAIEFNEPLWTAKHDRTCSSFDSGCHGKGKIHYCAYFLPGHIQVLSGPTSDCVFPLENKHTTMLLRRRVK